MTTLAREIACTYGEDVLDLVLVVYVNFYYSEIDIINLCARWIPRREKFTEKSYLVTHAHDEVKHARLFREGVRSLGIEWDSLDHDKYRVADISERFAKLFSSDDELEVLIGLNLYAEGVLALEEIDQLARSKPRYFPSFREIYRDELTHLAFGVKVAKRLVDSSQECRLLAQKHCDWYRGHLQQYLANDLAPKLGRAVDAGFISKDYVARISGRFTNVMGSIGLSSI
jgi:uncharacterized ferritin-like protein (DUF455 family)